MTYHPYLTRTPCPTHTAILRDLAALRRERGFCLTLDDVRRIERARANDNRVVEEVWR